MSLEHVDAERARRLDLPGIRILAVSRHRNKLKVGHLAGNRFEVRLRGCLPRRSEAESGLPRRSEAESGLPRRSEAESGLPRRSEAESGLPRRSPPAEAESCGSARQAAERILGVLQSRGVPNAFDYQRFGRRADNHLLGRDLVLGDYRDFCDRFLGRPVPSDSRRLAEARRLYDAGDLDGAQRLMGGQTDQLRVLSALIRSRDPERAARNLPKPLAKLFIAAFQSALFNDVLERRLDALDRIEPGDLAYLHPRPGGGGRGGAVFLVEDAAREAPRAARFEISPSGPIVGHRVTLASGRPGEVERAVLAEHRITPEHFERVKALRLRGDRRPLRFPLTDASVAEDGPDGLRVSFTLPPGAYATIVLGEITKSPAADATAPPADAPTDTTA